MKTLNDLRKSNLTDDEKALFILNNEFKYAVNNEKYKILINPRTKHTYELILANLTTGVIEKISDPHYFKDYNWRGSCNFFDYVDNIIFWWAYSSGFDPTTVINQFIFTKQK